MLLLDLPFLQALGPWQRGKSPLSPSVSDEARHAVQGACDEIIELYSELSAGRVGTDQSRFLALAPDDRRLDPRFETTLTGRLRLPASEYDCQIADISAGGMNVIAPHALVTVGLQVAVFSQGLPRLVGIIRWINGPSFGVQFTNPIPQQVIERMGQLKRRVRSPRAARVKTALPAHVFFDGAQYPVVVRNISVGGLMMTSDQPVQKGKRKPIRTGQALMIEIADLLPIGGHVRWSCGSQYGIMLSKFLSVAIAEEIGRMGNLNPAWIDDVRLAHIEAGTSAAVPPRS